MPKDGSRTEQANAEGVVKGAHPRVEDDLDEVYRYLKRQWREHPVAVTVTAFGVGVLLGVLFGGRRS
jgi:hypothetical protein